MRQDSVTIPVPNGIDWKGIGYLFSIAGALLLGAISWPSPEEPGWHLPALLGGVGTTIIGFAIRYLAHLKERKEMARTRRDAERAQ